MHGSLLHGFKQFAMARGGAAGWDEIARVAGVPGWFKSSERYPDEELKALVAAAAAAWDRSASVILEEFGEALVPTLLGLYGAFVAPEWRTLDVLTNVEVVIHRTVRMRDPVASPPRLQSRRVSEREVQIEYDSDRRLCAMAVGICKGVARHFNEMIAITQPTCMERGDAVCRLVVHYQDAG
jgi:hypothetical protein